MSEKRAAYRRKQKGKRGRRLLDKFKAAFDDDEASSLDVNPAFKRDKQITNSQNSRQEEMDQTDEERDLQAKEPVADKGLRLKKKLDRAILIVFVLIVLVLLALFYL